MKNTKILDRKILDKKNIRQKKLTFERHKNVWKHIFESKLIHGTQTHIPNFFLSLFHSNFRFIQILFHYFQCLIVSFLFHFILSLE